MDSQQNGASEVLDLDVAIIGSGFSGLYALHKLRNELGLNVQSFENALGVGGTWYWNRYPGARSDTEVSAYCYSFDRDLFFEWKWTARYPRQEEILAYLNRVADKWDLKRSIQFGTQVLTSTFDESINRWVLTTDKGQTVHAQFLLEGVGLLSSTHFPEFPGQSSFTGDLFHTARWPHERQDFTNKKVAVIGTGSSGIQVITEIASEAGHLTVFQRTPQYIVPQKNRPIDQELLKSIEEDWDGYWHSVLYSVTAFGFKESEISGESVSDVERERILEEAWNDGGGFQFMFKTFNDVGVSRVTNKAVTDFIKKKIRETVKDPRTAELLTPTQLYARRPLCCDGYYEAFNQDNVELIDAKANEITEITARGIRTADGVEHEFDVIVFATGFDAVTGNYLKIDQVGRGGAHLKDRWGDRPRTHLGLMVNGFPNMWTLYGPMGPFTNQPPLHEAQVNFAASMIAYCRANGIEAIEPTLEAETNWVDTCDSIANMTLFPETDSWINGSNVPGKPVTNFFYMGGSGAYMDCMRAAQDNEFADFTKDGGKVGAAT
jgi:cation diffusion facilitator CzcD-associated flavoprotein CzcO